jgi:tRNA nucleotidyltransferase (CCA-adding enzyme)
LKTYLVGGAVRDALLGLPVRERDWVVVGSSPQQMQAQGYQPVGKDFPVFLHPETKEEYALARTERKVGKGYKGFTFHADPNVTLEEDLIRRDLTINAIAQDETGTIFDPYNGQDDLKAKKLKHVSDAFAEDPVRILRIARFAAKLPEFSVDPETNQLMQQMVHNGEVDALVAERVWQELRRALDEAAPDRFFAVLSACDALQILFPPLENNIPDINQAQFTTAQRFALLFSSTAINDIKAICTRYKVPSEFRELALAYHQLKPMYHDLNSQDSQQLLNFLKRSDALRREQRFQEILELLAYLDGSDHSPLLKTALKAIKNIDTAPLQEQQLKGVDFANALESLQIEAIAKVI